MQIPIKIKILTYIRSLELAELTEDDMSVV